MKISELLKKYDKKVDIKTKIYILKNSFNITDKDILFNNELSKMQIIKYRNNIKKVKKEIPLQYITGKINFYNYDFVIKKGVLIPRFETENLVKYTIEYINKNFKNPKIIDVGCGSGIIGITLKKEIPFSEVICTDINLKALRLTKINSKKMNVKIKILRKNLLTKINEKYDILISNPPYISKTEEIEPIVYKNEPHNALFAKDNGLYFYNEIISSAAKNLNKKNIIAFEIGMNQAKDISSIAKKYFPNAKVIIKKDFNKRNRYLFILNNVN